MKNLPQTTYPHITQTSDHHHTLIRPIDRACPSIISCIRQTGLSGNSVIVAVLYYASTLVGAGEVTVGDLSAFLLYAAYAGVAVGKGN